MNEKAATFNYHLDQEVNCAFIRFHGVLTNQLVLEMVRSTMSDPKYVDGMSRCLDLRGILPRQNSDDLKNMAVQVKKLWTTSETHREAILLDNLLVHGLFRNFITLTNTSVDYRIFNTKNGDMATSLKNWLRLPVDYNFPTFFKSI